MNTSVKLLYLEDDAVDRRAFLRMVREKALPYELTAVETLAEARAHLAKAEFDIIIADYHLPDGHCTELFNEVPKTPFVLITGTLEEQLALRTLQRGADDYLPKDTQQRHLEAVPFTVEKTLYRHRIREREQQLARELRESEERFRLMVASVKDYAIFMLDHEGRVATWNTGAEQLIGYPADAIIGQHFNRFFTPEDLALAKPTRELSLATERGSYAEEGWRVRNDGSRFWASITITAVRSPDGALRGFAKVTQDLTARRQSEAALSRSERRFRAIFEHAGVGVVEIGPASRIIAVNNRVCQILGYPREELLGMTVHEITAPEDRERCINLHARLQEDQLEYFDYEKRYLRRDGSRLWVHATISAVHDSAGHFQGAIATIEDISERKATEERLQSEKAFSEAAINSLPGLFYLFDEQNRMRRWNHNMEVVTGYSTAEIQRMRPLDFIAPEDRPATLEAIRQVLITGEAAVEAHFLAKDGRRMPYTCSGKRFEIAQQSGVIGVALDIRDRKQAEDALHHQNQRLEILHEAAASLLSTYEPGEILKALHHRITQYFKTEAFMLFLVEEGSAKLRLRSSGGLDPETERQFAQLRFGHAICGSRLVREPVIVNHLQQSDAPYYRFVKKLGFRSYLYYPLLIGERLLGTLAFASRQRDAFDYADQEFFQTVARSVALAFERARLDAELRGHASHLETLVAERTAKLREMVAELEHFSYTITHDMRAPLRAMRMFGQILLDESAERLDATGKDYLQRITASAQRMDNLITDALQYSRAVRQELDLKPVDPGKLLHGMIQSYPAFQPPKADIRIEGEMPLVLATEASLTQCFSNLLNNAVKFVTPGTQPQIRIWAEQHDGSVRLWFADNGIGIPPENQARIFGMFERLSSAYEGTGIGLALVRKVMERMGGKVGVESEPGKGSHFWLDLKPADSQEE